MAAFGTTYLGGEWRALKPSIGGELAANWQRIGSELCDLTISEIAVVLSSELALFVKQL
jgi:hypothetical protein